MAEERSLPGWPKKRLVKEVRRHLWHHGIRPTRGDIWRATWAWAEAIARSYWHFHWPMPSEIGTLYLALLLIEMKQSCMLRLPYRAKEVVPPEVAAILPSLQQTNALAIAVESEPKPSRKRRRSSPSLKKPDKDTP